MKKIWRITELATIFLGLSILLITTTYAEEETIDLYNMYTQEEVEIIEYLIENNPEFDLADGEVVMVMQVSKIIDSLDSVTRGSIGNDIMTMTLSVQRIVNDGYDDFKFMVTADWLSAPVFRMQDAIAMSWSDEFSQYEHSCNAYYNSIGLVSGKTSQIRSTPEHGVAYSVESSDWYVQALDKVVLTVKARKYDSSGTAVLAAEYAHATASLGTGFSAEFKGGASISLTTTGLSDSMATDKYFEY